jgi:hypothetical protein
VAYFIIPRGSPKETEKLRSSRPESDWPPIQFRPVSGAMEDTKNFMFHIFFKSYTLILL